MYVYMYVLLSRVLGITLLYDGVNLQLGVVGLQPLASNIRALILYLIPSGLYDEKYGLT